MSNRFMKFYPSDWRSEPKLKLISRAARSLWVDMLGLMFDAGTGRLEVNGKPMTEKQLSDMLGDNPRTIKKLLAEIEEMGVSSRDHEGFIISRRIIRDFQKAEQDKSNGRKGGNPALKTRENDNQGVNPEVKTHIPEARSQNSSSSTREDISPDDLLTEVLAAVGLKSGKIPVHWMPPSSTIHVARWRSQLGLTDQQIIDTARNSRARHSDPPMGPKALDRAMQTLAGTIAEKPLTPKASGGPRNGSEFASAMRELEQGLSDGSINLETASRDPFAPQRG